MWTADRVIATLRARGELWEPVPGLVGLRGNALVLFRRLEAAIVALAAETTADEWRVPSGLSLEDLARADYFSAFPHWLTVASHLDDSPCRLESIARASDPAGAARLAAAPADAALTPAVCYHVFAQLARRTVGSPTRVTAQTTCWRHEGDRLSPLQRGWAFTMREIVCLGSPEETESFRQRALARALQLARSLGLDPAVEVATDPFFAPTAGGKAALQRIRELKLEMTLAIADDRRIAAASFNRHDTFFGERFGITLAGGGAASSACAAYGLERWLLAYLVAHGPDAAGWPPIGARESETHPHPVEAPDEP